MCVDEATLLQGLVCALQARINELQRQPCKKEPVPATVTNGGGRLVCWQCGVRGHMGSECPDSGVESADEWMARRMVGHRVMAQCRPAPPTIASVDSGALTTPMLMAASTDEEESINNGQGKAMKKKRKKKRKQVCNSEDAVVNVTVPPMSNVDKASTGEGVRASVAGAPTSEGEGAGGANDVMAVRRAELKKKQDIIGRQLLAAIRLPGDTQAIMDRLLDKSWALVDQEIALREQE